MNYLYDKLVDYSLSNAYPMHMPGHKRNKEIMKMINPYMIDITEIGNFDNLHNANGILKEAQDRAATLYKSEHTYFLINGSTVGILTGIAACTRKKNKILVARNSHKAVYNALFLNELNPIYIYPEIEEKFMIHGGINALDIEDMLIKDKEIKMVVITSPTYEGIVSDVEAIAKIVHKYGIPLMVDEAHGAHFGFTKDFPKSSVECGADIVIHSVHKTLPAFTQTAIMHVNGDIVNNEVIREYLAIYQTSSPSYILMSGIDQCIRILKEDGNELFRKYNYNLNEFYKETLKLKRIRILENEILLNKNSAIYDFDKSKIVILLKNTNMTGMELYDILRNEYEIEVEMVSKDYVLAMTSICDTKEGFDRLSMALKEIDKKICEKDIRDTKDMKDEKLINRDITGFMYSKMETRMSIYDSFYADKEEIKLENSVGRIVLEYIYLYPPGIPIIVPGEVMDENTLRNIIKCKKSKLQLSGTKVKNAEKILVKSEN